MNVNKMFWVTIFEFFLQWMIVRGILHTIYKCCKMQFEKMLNFGKTFNSPLFSLLFFSSESFISNNAQVFIALIASIYIFCTQ